MASINKVILIGNLGRDPETRYTTDGGTAITRLAEIAKEYLHKGSQCYIEGRLRTRKYQAKDGTDRYATEIIGETMQLLDRRQSDNQGMDDGFESAPRASRPAPQPAPQPARQSAPVTSNTPFDQLEGDDVPF